MGHMVTNIHKGDSSWRSPDSVVAGRLPEFKLGNVLRPTSQVKTMKIYNCTKLHLFQIFQECQVVSVSFIIIPIVTTWEVYIQVLIL